MTATELDREASAPRGKAFFPFLVFGIGIALSILLHFVIKDNVEGEAQLRFERQASDAQHVIEARIKSYADVLHGLGALFSTSNSLSRAEFHRYVVALDLPNRYPGFQGLNYAEYVPHEAKARFEARVRRDTSLDARGYPDFAIKPPGDRPEYFVLNYLEPLAANPPSGWISPAILLGRKP
jgi:CHASE1-domain containing sensor protein